MSHRVNGSKPHSPLRQATIDYMILRNLSENTQRRYLHELDKLSRHHRCSPSKLSAEQLRDYVLEQVNRGLSPATTNLTVASLRMFYTQVLNEPQRVELLAVRKISDKLPQTISESEINSLIAATHNLRYRVAIQLAYSTGLRISEVVALQVDDIDSARGMIRVGCGKGGHERVVFLPPTLLEALRSYYRQIFPKPQSWLFYGISPTEKLKTATLRNAFKQACKLAGIGEHFTFHCLRASVATHLLERGSRRDAVQDILGHKSPQSTRVYARTTAAMFRKLDHPANQITN